MKQEPVPVVPLLYILLKGECGEAYNIADAESIISICELAETIAGIGGRKVVMDLPDVDEKRGFNPVTKSVFSTEKIEVLGWLPESHIKTGILHTLKDLMK